MSGTPERLLSLLSLLQTRRDWPGQTLAGRLAVSSRTVRRDVDRLRELGYPIEATKGPEGGYRLGAGADLPPLLFDDDQAVALAIALHLATASGAGVSDAASRALATVRQVMPSRLRHRIDAVQVTPMRSADLTEADPAVLTALADAVRTREVVRFDYAQKNGQDSDGQDDASKPGSAPGSRASRRVEPYQLLSRFGRWYLLTWDLDRDDWRTYRADRITLRTPNGPRFTPREIPGGDAATFVSGLFKGSSTADEWPCTGSVVLYTAASAVLPFASDGTVEALGPDRCRLTMGSWSWAGLAASIARHDVDFEVEGPAELRAAAAELARRFSAAAHPSR